MKEADLTSLVVQFEAETSQSLIEDIMSRSGQNLLACYQCRRCAAGCPVADESGMTPDRLIRTIIFGDKETALNNMLVWKCSACYICGERCPNNIQAARIIEVLKEISKEEHREPLLPKVAAFHEAFLESASHLGRLNEIEFMALYEWKNVKRDLKAGGGWNAVIDKLKADAGLAVSMLKKRRLHLGMEKIGKLSEVKRLFGKKVK